MNMRSSTRVEIAAERRRKGFFFWPRCNRECVQCSLAWLRERQQGMQVTEGTIDIQKRAVCEMKFAMCGTLCWRRKQRARWPCTEVSFEQQTPN